MSVLNSELKFTRADIARLNKLIAKRDQSEFIACLGQAAVNIGMSTIAKRSGLAREGLYKSLSPGHHPNFNTIWRVLRAMGLELTIVPKKVKKPKPIRLS